MNGEQVIPYGKQWIDDEDIAAVVEVLRSDRLTQGPVVSRFEATLAEYFGAKHAIALCNGTVALHLACLAAGLGPGDEGITTPITFLASAACMVYCGTRPVFADIDSRTWNIDPIDLEKKITKKTRVVIPVDFAGLPCDMTEIRALADRNGLTVIEDACHAIGAEYKGRRIGAGGLADMTCFSFHPVKHITTGEGGAVLTDNDELAQKLLTLRHHGIVKDRTETPNRDGPWYYEAHHIGYNGRITDFQCALGIRQMAKLDRFLERRRKIASFYLEALNGLEGVTFQATPPDRNHAYHLFIAHLDPNLYDRRSVFEELIEHDIGPQVHYVPLYRQPAIRAVGGDQGAFPCTDWYYDGCISLPMFPSLTDDEQNRVIDAFLEAIKQGRR